MTEPEGEESIPLLGQDAAFITANVVGSSDELFRFSIPTPTLRCPIHGPGSSPTTFTDYVSRRSVTRCSECFLDFIERTLPPVELK